MCIFTEFKFSTYLWARILIKLKLQPEVKGSLHQQLEMIWRSFARKSEAQQMAYVTIVSTTHHNLVERVQRRFEGKTCTEEQRSRLIELDVRLQLRKQFLQSKLASDEKQLFEEWGIKLVDNG